MGTEKVNQKLLFNVSFIVIGVIIASFGEIKFVLIGFLFQLGGVCFEAMRLVLVQRLLSSAEYKMDPLVSLYYFAPVCATMNFCFAVVFEIPYMSMGDLYHVGLSLLLLNAVIAFALNVSAVFLVSTLSPKLAQAPTGLIETDWPDLIASLDPLRRAQGHPTSICIYPHLGYSSFWSTVLWLQHRLMRTIILQARSRGAKGTVIRNQPFLGRIRSPSPRFAQGRHLRIPHCTCLSRSRRPCASSRV